MFPGRIQHLNGERRFELQWLAELGYSIANGITQKTPQGEDQQT